jgi:hypothetical protein
MEYLLQFLPQTTSIMLKPSNSIGKGRVGSSSHAKSRQVASVSESSDYLRFFFPGGYLHRSYSQVDERGLAYTKGDQQDREVSVVSE